MAWYKMDDAMHADIKWPVVAKLAKVKVGTVVSIWVAILGYANQQEERGSLEGFDPETIDALYGYKEGTTQSVVDAMIQKQVITSNHVANWDKRQAGKEAMSGAERQRRYLERRKSTNASDADITANDADITANDADMTANDADMTANDENDALRIKNKNKRVEEDKEIKNTAPVRAGFSEEPSMEFALLRDTWNEHVRAEGDYAGFTEYKALKKARAWPGLDVIQNDILLRTEAGFWKEGYMPGLSRYLKERTWTAPIVSREPQVKAIACNTAASRPAGSNASSNDDAAAKSYRNYQELKRQRGVAA